MLFVGARSDSFLVVFWMTLGIVAFSFALGMTAAIAGC